MTTDLLELAERVEALEGPDRETECVIAKAIGFKPDHETQSPWAWCPTYTASLDAAMSLVLGDLQYLDFHLIDGAWEVSMEVMGLKTGSGNGRAKTRPLALCAAALRARAAA